MSLPKNPWTSSPKHRLKHIFKGVSEAHASWSALWLQIHGREALGFIKASSHLLLMVVKTTLVRRLAVYLKKIYSRGFHGCLICLPELRTPVGRQEGDTFITSSQGRWPHQDWGVSQMAVLHAGLVIRSKSRAKAPPKILPRRVVAKNLPANAGDMGSLPGRRRSHKPGGATKPLGHSSWACAGGPVGHSCWGPFILEQGARKRSPPVRSPHRQPEKSPSCNEDSTAKNKSINNFKKKYLEKKVLARNTAKPPAEGRGKAGQRRGQRAGGQEGQDGEGRGAGAEAGNSVRFTSLLIPLCPGGEAPSEDTAPRHRASGVFPP